MYHSIPWVKAPVTVRTKLRTGPDRRTRTKLAKNGFFAKLRARGLNIKIYYGVVDKNEDKIKEMEANSPIDIKAGDLSVADVLSYFKSAKNMQLSCNPPMKPKAGEVYLHVVGDNKLKRKCSSS